MADTLPNTPLPAGQYIDLYADTGLSVDTPIAVQNIGVCDVYLFTQDAQPTDDTAHQILKRGRFLSNRPEDAGAWALCLSADGLVNVRRAT